MFEFVSPPKEIITDMERDGDTLLAFFTNLVELPFNEHYKFENGIEVSVSRVEGDMGFTMDQFGSIRDTDMTPEEVVTEMTEMSNYAA